MDPASRPLPSPLYCKPDQAWPIPPALRIAETLFVDNSRRLFYPSQISGRSRTCVRFAQWAFRKSSHCDAPGDHKGGDIVMLKWQDVLNLAKNGNPAPDHRTEKTDAEWRQQLSPEEYHVTRQAGTERPFSSDMCSLFEPGRYSCLCCGTVLFDSNEKFESGTRWPSFTQPVKVNVIA